MDVDAIGDRLRMKNPFPTEVKPNYGTSKAQFPVAMRDASIHSRFQSFTFLCRVLHKGRLTDRQADGRQDEHNGGRMDGRWHCKTSLYARHWKLCIVDLVVFDWQLGATEVNAID